mmetsp:Transcript_61587/g.145182  ORF Transcript_61587/g.145182 Transcript_61587/m.145182 type:complete len:127 (-) Transcript_61587:27-407(-)
MRVFDLVRCLLNGFWLPHDPRGVLDVFKSTKLAGHRSWSADGSEDWAGQYIYCNGWDLANSIDPHFYYPVVVPYRPRFGPWLVQEQSKGLGWEGVLEVLALFFLCSSGLPLLALCCALALFFLKPT